MSAITIHAPHLRLPRPSARVIPFPDSRPAPAPACRPAHVDTPTRPLRLTRRGRLVISLLATVVLTVVVSIAASLPMGEPHLPAGPAASIPAEEVTVLPGESLWSIAAERSAGGDVRDLIVEIRELNDLESSGVAAGQRLLVPAGDE